MVPTVAIERLAQVAHDLWCHSMYSRGWRRGDHYDSASHLHDALVPFGELPALDRRESLLAASSLVDTIVAEIEHPRGADREFTTQDIQIGQAVALAEGGTFEEPSPAARGEITAWEAEPDTPFLRLIRVRWDTGQETEHVPSLRELRRLPN